MRVLIVRLSSMGDLVHTLPALTDAARAIPGVRFDWVVDEAFADVPRWHGSVDRVITSAHRRWGRELFQSYRGGELSRFWKAVREQHYDAVVDVQTEIKSAVVTRIAKGIRYGYDRKSVHEWGSQFAYERKFSVSKSQHSIQRMRQLLALSLGYSFADKDLDYGIDRSRLPALSLKIRQPFAVFIHSTSWTSKCWPLEYWHDLAGRVLSSGYAVVLPWGTQEEKLRSGKIAGNRPGAMVLPDMSISEKASVIAEAQFTLGCDTGLSHIAAALSIPSLTIYGATDPALIGATGRNQIHIVSEFECVRCHQTKCTYPKNVEPRPSCLAGMTPDFVWSKLGGSVMNQDMG